MVRFLLVALLVVGFGGELHGQDEVAGELFVVPPQEEEVPPPFVLRLRQRYVELATQRCREWSDERLQEEVKRLELRAEDLEAEGGPPEKAKLASDIDLLLEDRIVYFKRYAEQHPNTEAGTFAAMTSRVLMEHVELAKRWAAGKGPRLRYGD